MPVCDLIFTEALARWLPFLNTMKFSISVASIGGEIGEKCSGNTRGFTGSLGGRHMLKKKENAPEWVDRKSVV